MREHPSQDFSEVIYFVSKDTGKGYGSTLMYYMKKHVEEKFLRPKGAKIFRVNREMREKITVYDPILDEFRAKLKTNYKTGLCQNFEFWF